MIDTKPLQIALKRDQLHAGLWRNAQGFQLLVDGADNRQLWIAWFKPHPAVLFKDVRKLRLNLTKELAVKDVREEVHA